MYERCMYVCMHVCMHACMHACMHVCMYVFLEFGVWRSRVLGTPRIGAPPWTRDTCVAFKTSQGKAVLSISKLPNSHNARLVQQLHSVGLSSHSSCSTFACDKWANVPCTQPTCDIDFASHEDAFLHQQVCMLPPHYISPAAAPL